MNFLEAHRLVEGFNATSSQSLRVALSGTGDPLALYIKAAGVRQGVSIEPEFLPFNTLVQHLLTPADGTREVFLLLPWDLAPELDWRSGIPKNVDDERLLDRAQVTMDRVSRRGASVLYLAAAVPPVIADHNRLAELLSLLRAVAARAGAIELPSQAFSLTSYLNTGCPIAGTELGNVALALVGRALTPKREPAKVLISDLDNVMWKGVVAEDGLEGIAFGPQGTGYPHFLYQTLLARLKDQGVLLAAVSRNDPEVALGPFRSGQMVLKEEDFVTILASYNAKSVQVQALADQLNLGLDAFVFVDDNNVELEEMRLRLPAVRLEAFPTREGEVPALLNRLSAHFPSTQVTAEDRDRTAMYRRRLASLVPEGAEGADLRDFLKSLEMTLVVHDRTSGDRERAVQLINKTNQFNINGRRVAQEDVAGVLASGGKLLTATLNDRNGTHGEILAILLDADHVVKSMVMSCRVFNRRAEFAFLSWLASGAHPPRVFEVAETPRNEPARRFFAEPGFRADGEGLVTFDRAAFLEAHDDVRALFQLVEQ